MSHTVLNHMYDKLDIGLCRLEFRNISKIYRQIKNDVIHSQKNTIPILMIEINFLPFPTISRFPISPLLSTHMNAVFYSVLRVVFNQF